ncbi:hypothetical protein ACUNWD_15175 [Sunxiuqinia sp. A32]|uniref:hypothetical protein n=1 Tax=Sunxiuqinia sp. A32 TaxID=3461496 RepID=UPI00404600F0
MFFLGLAGSFMPYLLFLGVLLFLTIGTHKGQDEKLAVLEEKTIEDPGFNTQQDLTSENGYYFFETNEIQPTQDNIKSLRQNTFIIMETKSPPMKLLCNVMHHYGFQFNNSYSGLSPPSLIS